jgi:septum formation topological specificity factor MinE
MPKTFITFGETNSTIVADGIPMQTKIFDDIMLCLEEHRGSMLNSELLDIIERDISAAISRYVQAGYVDAVKWQDDHRIVVSIDNLIIGTIKVSPPDWLTDWMESIDEESKDAGETCCQCEQATQTYREPSDF